MSPDDVLPLAATTVIVRDGRAGLEVLMIERPSHGTFAGAWVFPGGKVDDADGDGDETERARVAAVRETREETGLVLDPAGLVMQACWMPPAEQPVRIRTWFFVAADPGGEVVRSEAETVEAAWLRPGEALERHAAGALQLVPPTWVTLHGLAQQDDVAAVLAATRLAGPRLFETRLLGPVLLWPGDDEYEPGATGPARHRLDTGVEPWRYTVDL